MTTSSTQSDYQVITDPSGTSKGQSMDVYGDFVNWNAVKYGDYTTWTNILNWNQGDNQQKIDGDCGVVSCENLLIEDGLLGPSSNAQTAYNLETEVLAYALKKGFCDSDGENYNSDQVNILKGFGLAAQTVNTTLQTIGQDIKAGYGVLASVASDILWGTHSDNDQIDHEITITGVAYSASSPTQIDGFYICDSGEGIASAANEFINLSLMEEVITGNTHASSTAIGTFELTDNPITYSPNSSSSSSPSSSSTSPSSSSSPPNTGICITGTSTRSFIDWRLRQ